MPFLTHNGLHVYNLDAVHQYRGNFAGNGGSTVRMKKRKIDPAAGDQIEEEQVLHVEEMPSQVQVPLKTIQDILVQNGTYAFTDDMADMLPKYVSVTIKVCLRDHINN
jgi:hypothetical protein